jgi:hypothetical protein
VKNCATGPPAGHQTLLYKSVMHNFRYSHLMVIGWGKSITLVILPPLFTRV